MTWELRLTLEEKRRLVRVQRARRAIRDFLHERGFLEVDIPTIFPSQSFMYGGIPVSGKVVNGYLCPVMTPFIRRWLVFLSNTVEAPRVYVIGKCFRDEEIDRDHYPEFENLALGVCGEDYHFLMQLIQEMVSWLAKVIDCEDLSSWRRISFRELFTALDPNGSTFEHPGLLQEYDSATKALTDPTFVTELPQRLFGPAKAIPPSFKERAELFIEGVEIGNIASFLTDPHELEAWYAERNIDFSLCSLEWEHLESISSLRGAPITTGAIGLSRLYKALIGAEKISQVIPFPYFRG